LTRMYPVRCLVSHGTVPCAHRCRHLLRFHPESIPFVLAHGDMVPRQSRHHRHVVHEQIVFRHVDLSDFGGRWGSRSLGLGSARARQSWRDEKPDGLRRAFSYATRTRCASHREQMFPKETRRTRKRAETFAKKSMETGPMQGYPYDGMMGWLSPRIAKS